MAFFWAPPTCDVATFAIKAMAGFYDGSNYTYAGEQALGVPDGDGNHAPPSMNKQTLATIPVPTSLTFTLMSNPMLALVDGRVDTVGDKYFRGWF